MRINSYDKTKFCAFLKNPITIEKIGKDGIPQRANASFVQIDCDNKWDIKALENIGTYWENSLYGNKYYNTAMLKFKKEKYHKIYDVYALTLQQENFEKLNPDEIMGVVEVMHIGDKKINIEHIEGKPEYVNEINRRYNEIGTSMLKSLKKFYNVITLTARKSKAVSNFYIKNEFVETSENSGFFVWIKDAFLDFNSMFL